jgi:hypothetical protein
MGFVKMLPMSMPEAPMLIIFDSSLYGAQLAVREPHAGNTGPFYLILKIVKTNQSNIKKKKMSFQKESTIKKSKFHT